MAENPPTDGFGLPRLDEQCPCPICTSFRSRAMSLAEAAAAVKRASRIRTTFKSSPDAIDRLITDLQGIGHTAPSPSLRDRILEATHVDPPQRTIPRPWLRRCPECGYDQPNEGEDHAPECPRTHAVEIARLTSELVEAEDSAARMASEADLAEAARDRALRERDHHRDARHAAEEILLIVRSNLHAEEAGTCSKREALDRMRKAVDA